MLDESVKRISAKSSFFDLRLYEIMKYKDLIRMFVKRNYVSQYKQTILGALWLVINPIFSVAINVVLFGVIAGLSTDGIPKPLFHFLNNILWSFFCGCVISSANCFLENAGLFGKVYFPRMIVPISSAITHFIDFMIKFFLLMLLIIFYYFFSDYKISINVSILLLPCVFIQFAMLGIGLGIIISSLTVKYRDLHVLVNFGMQIWMFLTPVVYTLSDIPERWRFIYVLNPVYPGFIVFKHALFYVDEIPLLLWLGSIFFSFGVFTFGLMLFNHVERTFMDTI